MNAAEALKYYWKEIERSRDIAQEVERAREKAAVELGQVKYYTREGAGIWYGKAVELAGLPREVTEEHLRLMLEGKTLDGERMGARLNTTREAIVRDKDGRVLLDPDTGEPATKDVANRRCGTDWTFSLDKASSCYLARTGDPVYRAIVQESLEEQLGKMETEVQTQVNEDGKHFMRTTGNWFVMVTIHFTGRPVDGKEDPHWHAHCVVPNQTWDAVEGRWKAMEQGVLYAQKARHQAEFHARVHAKALAAGYGLRRTDKGVELSVWQPEETRIFCKRTDQIEKELKKQELELRERTAAIVNEAAKRGFYIDYDLEYARQKDQLGERTREGKADRKKTAQELDKEWREQLPPGRWGEITVESAKAAKCENFLDAETAKKLTLEHCFDKQSLARGVDVIATILQLGVGSVSVAEAAAWLNDETVFRRKQQCPGKVTTLEIVREEERIKGMVVLGQGKYEPISRGKEWKLSNNRLDDYQRGSVRLVVETGDLAIGVLGKPGAGKTSAIGEASLQIERLTGKRPFTVAQSAKAVQAMKRAAGTHDACTLDLLRTDPRLQKAAAGRAIFCDEASLLSNDHVQWLIEFARDNNCRLSLWGDPKQFHGVKRGDSFRDLTENEILRTVFLEKIHRQSGVLKEITDSLHAGQLEKGFDLIQNNGMTYEGQTYNQALSKVTDNVVAERKERKTSMVIALLHRHGEEITREIRAKLKAEDLIGLEDRQVKRLQAVDMSDAERCDHVNFRKGQVIQPHAILPGGLRPGQQWSVSRVENEQVFVERGARELLLPLSHAKHFQVYTVETMALAIGDPVRMTRNNRKYDITTGQLRTVKAMDQSYVTLDDGKKLDLSEPLHIAQGYTLTGETCQGSEERRVHLFAPAEASPKIDGTTMLVAESRATESFTAYTDCMPVLRACATRSQERESATYDRPMEQSPQTVNGRKIDRSKQGKAVKGASKKVPGVDLQVGARNRSIGRGVMHEAEGANEQARISAAMEQSLGARHVPAQEEREIST